MVTLPKKPESPHGCWCMSNNALGEFTKLCCDKILPFLPRNRNHCSLMSFFPFPKQRYKWHFCTWKLQAHTFTLLIETVFAVAVKDHVPHIAHEATCAGAFPNTVLSLPQEMCFPCTLLALFSFFLSSSHNVESVGQPLGLPHLSRVSPLPP